MIHKILYCIHYEIYMDHRSLQLLKSYMELKSKKEKQIQLLNNYDISILHQLRKVNIIATTLNQKVVSIGTFTLISTTKRSLAWDLQALLKLMVLVDVSDSKRIFESVKAKSTLFQQILGRQFDDSRLCSIYGQVLKGPQGTLDSKGIFRYDGHICVLRFGDLIQLTLREAHISRYSVHFGTTKMY